MPFLLDPTKEKQKESSSKATGEPQRAYGEGASPLNNKNVILTSPPSDPPEKEVGRKTPGGRLRMWLGHVPFRACQPLDLLTLFLLCGARPNPIAPQLCVGRECHGRSGRDYSKCLFRSTRQTRIGWILKRKEIK
ncbi:hypothetical protein NPIL_650341 [Nephila pilipes]|uniref:Uncharacterized protein n=1 Tax=Nephila pilipes TaxID=299642 RepID=A0A8X6UN44_NEPPI|nr:hypothetical protein NPIL_650341 [Nephila pilipes]